jgi:hypothetical protein
MEGRLGDAPSFYIDHFRRGSLSLVLILSAASFWLLENTIGESVKDAYRRTRLHRRMVDYLSSGEHDRRIANQVKAILVNEEWSERFTFHEIEESEDHDGNLLLRVSLRTPSLLEETLDHPDVVMDSAFVAEEIREGRAAMRRPKKKRPYPQRKTPEQKLLDGLFGARPRGKRHRRSSSAPGAKDAGPTEVAYVRRETSDVWHWCWNCSKFPQVANVVVAKGKPSSGRRCKECRAKADRGECSA